MSRNRDVAVLVGSLRKDSINRRIAQAFASLAPEGYAFNLVQIGQLPMYNQDFDAASPSEYVSFRERIRQADALLFVTPEYNRSMPAVMKNALDVGSRPYGESVWNGKPGGVISASPGSTGAFGANHHLRQTLVFLNVPTLQQPEAYLSAADKVFDDQGQLLERTRTFLQNYMNAYVAWVERLLAAAPES